MSVIDHGLEAIRKAAEQVTPGDKSDYYIKVRNATLENTSVRAFSTPSNTRPTVTTASSTILAANAARRYAYVFNSSGAVIYLKLGTTAVVNEGIRLPNNEIFEITSDKLWTGVINAIRGAGSGAIEVFEGTA